MVPNFPSQMKLIRLSISATNLNNLDSNQLSDLMSIYLDQSVPSYRLETLLN